MDEAEYIRERLMEAKQMREDFPERSPRVYYCVECDEILVDEWPDCPVGHVIVSEGWETAGINYWLECMRHFDLIEE